MYENELQELLKREGLRSADQANMKTMLRKVRRGNELSYQERMNLFAYCNRYGVNIVDTYRH